MIKPYSASLLYGVACFVFRIYKGKIVSVANAFVPNAQTYQNEVSKLPGQRIQFPIFEFLLCQLVGSRHAQTLNSRLFVSHFSCIVCEEDAQLSKLSCSARLC